MMRRPAVAGAFYPGHEAGLRGMIERMFDPGAEKKKALVLVAPHAGYEYSGPVAGALYASTVLPRTVLILGPAHRDIRPLFAVQGKGSWATPLGEAPVDARLSELLSERCRLVEEDERAHLQEHSLEVQLPFLQYFRPDVSIVPVCVSYQAGYNDLADLGRAIAAAVVADGREVLVVASTDMSHYVSQSTAEKMDARAIRKILDLDPRGLFDTVRDERISMCGYQPTTAALVAGRELGASGAELVRYQTSGERTGDFAQVVGYAGIRVF